MLSRDADCYRLVCSQKSPYPKLKPGEFPRQSAYWNPIREELLRREESPLQIAVRKDHVKVLKLLLSKCESLPYIESSNPEPGNISLQAAVTTCSIEVLRLLLTKVVMGDQHTGPKRTALQSAAGSRSVEIVQSLLDAGALIDGVSEEEERTPLECAAIFGNAAVVKLLLSKGADKCRLSSDGSNLLLQVAPGKPSILKYLLDAGIDCNEPRDDGLTALHLATQFRRAGNVQVLLDGGAEPDAVSQEGQTSLHCAVRNGYDDVVQLLLVAGADKDRLDNSGFTPLLLAIDDGNANMVRLLLRNGADKNKGGQYTPLGLAVEKGHADIVHLLLAADVDIEGSTEDGSPPLFLAAKNNNSEAARLLLEMNADPNRANHAGVTPLGIAAEKGHWRVVRLLLNSGALTELCPKDGKSPLAAAAANYKSKVVKLLLNAPSVSLGSADITLHERLFIAVIAGDLEGVRLALKEMREEMSYDVPIFESDDWLAREFDEYLCCLLGEASRNGHLDIVKCLLGEGADPYRVVNEHSALGLAILGGNKDIVTLLLDDALSNDYEMPRLLYLAARKGHSEIVQLLLGRGADANEQAADLCSPLHIAARYGHLPVVACLLESGAEIDNNNEQYGATPLFFAAQNGQGKVVKLLIGRGAQLDLTIRHRYLLQRKMGTIRWFNY